LGMDPSSPNISASGSVGLLDTGMALILVALLPLYERFKPPQGCAVARLAKRRTSPR